MGEAPSNDSDREDMGRDSNRSDIEPHDVAPEAGLLEVATSSSVLFSTGLAWDRDEPSISFSIYNFDLSREVGCCSAVELW